MKRRIFFQRLVVPMIAAVASLRILWNADKSFRVAMDAGNAVAGKLPTTRPSTVEVLEKVSDGPVHPMADGGYLVPTDLAKGIIEHFGLADPTVTCIAEPAGLGWVNIRILS